MPEITIALIQFDAVPERVDENLAAMERLLERAVESGARWVMFHEATVVDYTPKLSTYAEGVPDGPSTVRIMRAATKLQCFVSFGLAEVEDDRYYITQVFVGPQGFIYRYRKTWLCRKPDDEGYRNEWQRFDPGTGPELFEFDGVNATCFVCADGAAPRCIERARQLEPQVVFYPHNVRKGLGNLQDKADAAKRIGAPVLVTNRVGYSWTDECMGGCAVFSAEGEPLARANQENREEILVYTLLFT